MRFIKEKGRALWQGLQKDVRRFADPKLGKLSHHPPKPLHLPGHYAHTPLPRHPALFSVVTPSFNQAAFFERTIHSVLDQRYPRLEYIVQDGGSTDGTVDILRRHEEALKHWESRLDDGQSQAINHGFRHATGDVMAYLNSDDLLLPGSLAYIASYFESHPKVDVVYGHRILIDEEDQEIGRWILPPHDNEVLSWADYIPQETLFWRRRIWQKVGSSLDENFRFAMDWDLILRFRAAGARFARLPRFLGAFRVHARQKTSTQISDLGHKEMARLRRRCHGRIVSPEEINRRLKPYMARHIVYHRLYGFNLYLR